MSTFTNASSPRSTAADEDLTVRPRCTDHSTQRADEDLTRPVQRRCTDHVAQQAPPARCTDHATPARADEDMTTVTKYMFDHSPSLLKAVKVKVLRKHPTNDYYSEVTRDGFTHKEWAQNSLLADTEKEAAKCAAPALKQGLASAIATLALYAERARKIQDVITQYSL